MSYGTPPPDPNPSVPRGGDPAPPLPGAAPYHPPQPGAAPSWPAAPGWPPAAPSAGAPAPAGPRKGPWPALAALVLGLIGVLLPLSPSDVEHTFPIDAGNTRPILAFVFGLPGLALAVLGLTGRRRGLALAVVGITLSGLAVLVGLIMVANLAA